MSAIALAIAAGGAIKSSKTTVLMTGSEILGALKNVTGRTLGVRSCHRLQRLDQLSCRSRHWASCWPTALRCTSTVRAATSGGTRRSQARSYAGVLLVLAFDAAVVLPAIHRFGPARGRRTKTAARSRICTARTACRPRKCSMSGSIRGRALDLSRLPPNAPDAHPEGIAYRCALCAMGSSRVTFPSEMTGEIASNPHLHAMVLLMADPKPEEDNLAIPPFLDRRRPELKPDRKAAQERSTAAGWLPAAPKSKP
jgi:hypothetical protein